MPKEVIVLDTYEDPLSQVLTFVEKHGNPVYLYQDDDVDDCARIVSTESLTEREVKTTLAVG